MKVPLQIAFRNMKRSAWAEQLVREHEAKLDSFCANIMRCRVVVKMPHRHHRQGNFYSVRIDLTVPGKEIVVNREPSEHAAYQDFQAAVRDAFDSAKRKLEDYVRVRRRDVKSHEAPQTNASIVQLLPEPGYGVLETSDGREIYFHQNSVINEKFEHLKPGMKVSFVEEEGEKGPQASTVRVIKSKKGSKSHEHAALVESHPLRTG